MDGEAFQVKVRKWVDADYDKGFVMYRERGEGRWYRVLELDASGEWAATAHGDMKFGCMHGITFNGGFHSSQTA